MDELDELEQKIEAAEQELAMLKVEIAALWAKKSIIECIREAYATDSPVAVIKRKVRRNSVEVTILETDFKRLTKQAYAAAWIERKIIELNHLGRELWQKVNKLPELKAAFEKAKKAEELCRMLDAQLHPKPDPQQQSYDLEDNGGLEKGYQDYEGIEIQ